jgi:uncharacterized membrane protein
MNFDIDSAMGQLGDLLGTMGIIAILLGAVLALYIIIAIGESISSIKSNNAAARYYDMEALKISKEMKQ